MFSASVRVGEEEVKAVKNLHERTGRRSQHRRPSNVVVMKGVEGSCSSVVGGTGKSGMGSR